MYLRTPKRYQKGHRRSIISLRWLWLWILTPIVVYAGFYIYDNREMYIPQVEAVMDTVLEEAQSNLATVTAPTPMPTENPTIRLAAAQSAWERGSIEEAVNIYQEVLGAMPNTVEPHYRVALGLIMESRPEEAVAAAEDAITADPFDPNGWAIRAMALDWSGQPGLAAASAQRAIELAGQGNPQAVARAQAFLAEAYYDMELYDRALSTVNQALETDPNSYEAYRNRALIVQSTQFDFAAAQSDLEIAHDLAPHLPYITIDLALILAREDVDASLAVLNELVELNPQNPRVLYLLGSIYLNRVGDLASAADYLSRCVEVDPESISCHYVLGRTQMREQQYTAAAQSFQAALDLGSEDPRHYWWAGYSRVVSPDAGCPAATQYFQRGYPLAQQSGDETLVGDYEDQMRACGMLGPAPEATEEATEEPAADANA